MNSQENFHETVVPVDVVCSSYYPSARDWIFRKDFLVFGFSEVGNTEQAAVWPRKKRKSNMAKGASNFDGSGRYVHSFKGVPVKALSDF